MDLVIFYCKQAIWDRVKQEINIYVSVFIVNLKIPMDVRG